MSFQGEVQKDWESDLPVQSNAMLAHNWKFVLHLGVRTEDHVNAESGIYCLVAGAATARNKLSTLHRTTTKSFTPTGQIQLKGVIDLHGHRLA